jgi:hypothetical protein
VTEFPRKFNSHFQQHPSLARWIRPNTVLYSNQETTVSMSSALNAIQIEANRRNAQQSTGPRSDLGKQKFSLNALRHGLTARVVVLPTEDFTAYQRFSAEFLADLAPETFAERQCAQTIIDTQ